MGIPITIKILDTFRESGLLADAPKILIFDREVVTLAELIEKRVLSEVEARERASEEGRSSSSPLVELDDRELRLNGPGKKEPAPQVDRAKAVARALDDFRRSSYFVIVNGQQVTELQQALQLNDQTEVEFFRLVPLVGG